MRFEMFTEHEIELFALHINSMYIRILILFFNSNEFFLSICMEHTDKNVLRKCFFLGEGFFGTVYCKIARASGASAAGPPPGLCSELSGGRVYSAPRPQLLEAMTYGHAR